MLHLRHQIYSSLTDDCFRFSLVVISIDRNTQEKSIEFFFVVINLNLVCFCGPRNFMPIECFALILSVATTYNLHNEKIKFETSFLVIDFKAFQMYFHFHLSKIQLILFRTAFKQSTFGRKTNKIGGEIIKQTDGYLTAIFFVVGILAEISVLVDSSGIFYSITEIIFGHFANTTEHKSKKIVTKSRLKTDLFRSMSVL